MSLRAIRNWVLSGLVVVSCLGIASTANAQYGYAVVPHHHHGCGPRVSTYGYVPAYRPTVTYPSYGYGYGSGLGSGYSSYYGSGVNRVPSWGGYGMGQFPIGGSYGGGAFPRGGSYGGGSGFSLYIGR
jgi:hypothetical protein